MDLANGGGKLKLIYEQVQIIVHYTVYTIFLNIQKIINIIYVYQLLIVCVYIFCLIYTRKLCVSAWLSVRCEQFIIEVRRTIDKTCQDFHTNCPFFHWLLKCDIRWIIITCFSLNTVREEIAICSPNCVQIWNLKVNNLFLQLNEFCFLCFDCKNT